LFSFSFFIFSFLWDLDQKGVCVFFRKDPLNTHFFVFFSLKGKKSMPRVILFGLSIVVVVIVGTLPFLVMMVTMAPLVIFIRRIDVHRLWFRPFVHKRHQVLDSSFFIKLTYFFSFFDDHDGGKPTSLPPDDALLDQPTRREPGSINVKDRWSQRVCVHLVHCCRPRTSKCDAMTTLRVMG
jgi:hypothetical protein